MVAYTYQMPCGIPGQLTRVTSYSNVEAQIMSQTSPPTAFGVACSLVSGAIAVYTASTSTLPYGLLVRDFPTSASSTTAQSALGTATPNPAFPCSVMISGYMNVAIQTNTTAPTKGGTVFIRNANATAGQLLGGFETVSSGNNFPLAASMGSNSYYTGGMDSAGNTEIAFNVI